MTKNKQLLKKRRKERIRAKIFGTKEKPRINVFISNRHIFAQIIDDLSGKTLVALTDTSQKGGKDVLKGNNVKIAALLGKNIAKIAAAKKISKVVFDRNGRIYHGRIKAFAESARKGGLKF